MKYAALFLSVFIFSGIYVNAQSPSPTPLNPNRRATGSRSNTSGARETNTQFEQLRSLEIRQTEEKVFVNPLGELAETIYRKPNKEEIKLLSPSQYLLDKYDAFLRQQNVGITKLSSDSGCVEKSNVLNVKENCLHYAIPGAGTAFSFRIENYRVPHLADLILSNDVLKTDGVLQQGLMVALGDVPLEKVTLETKGLKYLLDFKPANDADVLSKNDLALSKGVEADGFLYRMGFYVTDKTTFALRSIAYKGKFMRSVKGISYNELDFDKRKDIVVAFRVIEKDSYGNITLIWKILSENNSPVMKIKQSN